MSLLPRSSCLAVLALVAASGVHAAELGDASVRSYTGQPLAAEIELTDLSAQELADLQVRLARPDVFQGANVKMAPALAGATISVGKRDSRRVLRVSTSAPVQGEVLHLYFQLVSGGKEQVRGVTLWLSPAPAAPAPLAVPAAPALAAATPVPSVAERADKPAVRRAGGDAVARLVAIGAPGKEATSGERELLGAVERAFSARGGNVEMRGETKSMPAPGRKDVRTEALKHASTADDFRRGAKPARPAAAQQEPEKAASKELAAEPQEEKKAPARSILASKSDLAEAARATRASVEAGIDINKGVGKSAGKSAAVALAAAPAKTAAAQPGVQPAGAQPDPAMLTKLAELEGKLKTLQAQLAITNTAGAASVAAPAASAAHPMAQVAEVARPAPVSAAVAGAEQHGAAQAMPAIPAVPAAGEAAKPGIAQHNESVGEHVATSAEAASAAAVATVEEAKPKPEEKKAAEPPPPEPKKEIKISRPKLLTFLFAGSLVLLAIFGVIVHFVRKAKMRRSPIVRQSWSRDEDDVPARTEPTAGPVPAPAPAAPAKA